MNTTDIKNMLSKSTCKISYTKKNGEVRIATATNNPTVVESHVDVKGGECLPKRVGYIPYFDLDKKAFRCFHPDSLISIEAM